jgi:predicted CopG family antitoxin
MVMQKELTINVDEPVYDELQRIGRPEDISQFIESLILHQLRGQDLESAYQQMAEDEPREAEALEWAEAMIGDADATRCGG